MRSLKIFGAVLNFGLHLPLDCYQIKESFVDNTLHRLNIKKTHITATNTELPGGFHQRVLGG